MGYDHAAGYSKATPYKQEGFRAVLNVHLGVVEAIRRKYHNASPYVYIDLTAGPGTVAGQPGSPRIFMDTARFARVPYLAFFCEKDPATLRALQALVDRTQHPRGSAAFVIPGDHALTGGVIADAMQRRVREEAYGLIYADPNEYAVPWATIRALVGDGRFRKLDVLLNVNAGALKRTNGAHHKGWSLPADLAALRKTYHLIREYLPGDSNQFSLVFLSDLKRFEDRPFPGFVGVRSKKGQEWFDRLQYTAAELKAQLQPALFPIAPTPSIYGTRPSAPCAPSSLPAPGDRVNGAANDRPATPTTSAIRPGEPSTSPETSSRSAGPATLPSMAKRAEDGLHGPGCQCEYCFAGLSGQRSWDAQEAAGFPCTACGVAEDDHEDAAAGHEYESQDHLWGPCWYCGLAVWEHTEPKSKDDLCDLHEFVSVDDGPPCAWCRAGRELHAGQFLDHPYDDGTTAHVSWRDVEAG